MTKSKSKNPSSARYVIYIPTHDNHSNPLIDLSPWVYNELHRALPRKIHSMHVEGPHNSHVGMRNHLHVLALDLPETDSHIKQITTQLTDWVNHQAMMVTKEGQRGLEVWSIPGRMFNGGTAHPDIIL